MCQNSVKWVFELEEDYSWESGFTFTDDFAFKDKTGIVRLILFRNGKITVTKGYAWDGCSPKICIFDILIGTPDGVVDSRTKSLKHIMHLLYTMHSTSFFPMASLLFGNRQMDVSSDL